MGVGDFPAGAPTEVLGIGQINAAPGAAGAPAISDDGRFVAFVTDQALVPEDTNNAFDIYLYEANNNSRGAALSRDGRFVSFLSTASNLVPHFTNNVFVRDVQSQTTLHPPSVASPISAKLSGDGRFLVEYASSQAMMISEA